MQAFPAHVKGALLSRAIIWPEAFVSAICRRPFPAQSLLVVIRESVSEPCTDGEPPQAASPHTSTARSGPASRHQPTPA